MKKFVCLMFVAALVVSMAACGKKDSGVTAETGAAASSAAETKAKESAAETKAAADDGYWFFPDADEFVEIPMGTCVDGVQTEVCTVKLPKNYTMFFMYTDENGESQTMTDVTTLDLILQFDQLAQEYIPSRVGFGVSESLGITPYDEEWAEYFANEPGRVEVSAPEGCKCYVYPEDETRNVTKVYYIVDDKWIIIWQDMSFDETKSLEELGQQFMKLITVK